MLETAALHVHAPRHACMHPQRAVNSSGTSRERKQSLHPLLLPLLLLLPMLPVSCPAPSVQGRSSWDRLYPLARTLSQAAGGASKQPHLAAHHVEAGDGDVRQQRPPVQRRVVRHQLSQRVWVCTSADRIRVKEQPKHGPGGSGAPSAGRR